MTRSTYKALFTFIVLTLLASPVAQNSYAQGSGDDCSSGSTHPRCDSVMAAYTSPNRPNTRLQIQLVDTLIFVQVISDASSSGRDLMSMCDPGQVRSTSRTLDNLLIELEQCPDPRGFDPLPENWIDSSVSFTTASGAQSAETYDGEWINLPYTTEDERAQGYSFARTRITITARPRSR